MGGLIVLAIVVGLGGAVGAALFHLIIYVSTNLFYGPGAAGNFIGTISALSLPLRILIPTLGGLLVGVIYKYAKVTEAEGEGVPEVMEALAHHRGNIRPIVAPVKIITAAITLGSGGSAGREGPVIQIGSAIGSSVGQWLKLDTEKRSLLLAAGAAAGIGGTFGAPIAGLLFTTEILGHKLTLTKTLVIAIASLVGTFGAQALTGGAGLRFLISNNTSVTFTLVITLVCIGMLSAFVAIGFGSVLTKARAAFQSLSFPHLLKPALGGLIIGMVGLYLPYIHEPAAYPLTIDLIQIVSIPLFFLVALFIVKIFATAITLGSGGSGGIFAPLLLTGALLGSLLSQILLSLEMIDISTATTIVVVGMAAVFAAAAHAPLTAAFILVEMTENIMLLPLLLGVCYLAVFVAKNIKKDSVYQIQE